MQHTSRHPSAAACRSQLDYREIRRSSIQEGEVDSGSHNISDRRLCVFQARVLIFFNALADLPSSAQR